MESKVYISSDFENDELQEDFLEFLKKSRVRHEEELVKIDSELMKAKENTVPDKLTVDVTICLLKDSYGTKAFATFSDYSPEIVVSNTLRTSEDYLPVNLRCLTLEVLKQRCVKYGIDCHVIRDEYNFEDIW